MSADILQIGLSSPPAGTVAFNLQFSPTGSDPWTDYSTVADPPTQPEDLPDTDLVANVYTLDGENAASGNMARASDRSNWFRARWKIGSVYTRWGEPFRVFALEPAFSGTSYLAPTPDDIRNRSGVNGKIDNLSASDLDGLLMSLLADAEIRTALAVGVTIFDSNTLTSRQVRALQIAVSKRAGADYLRDVATRRVTGTQSPRMMELAAALREQADALETEAETYDALAKGVIAEDEELGELQTGEITTSNPNEYLDSFRPEWRTLNEIVTE